MKIEIVGTNTATTAAVNVVANATFGNQHFAPRSQGRGGVMGRLRGDSSSMWRGAKDRVERSCR